MHQIVKLNYIDAVNSKLTTMATSGNGKRQRKEPGWYELYANGWIESDSETDNPQEVAFNEINVSMGNQFHKTI